MHSLKRLQFAKLLEKKNFAFWKTVLFKNKNDIFCSDVCNMYKEDQVLKKKTTT